VKAPPPLFKRILLLDPRNKSISIVDDMDLESLISKYLGDIGVDKLQLDHNNTIWFSSKAVSTRYAWFFEGLATGEYEVRRYCMGIVVGFGDNTAWDSVNSARLPALSG
jgi:hypothetical protein